MATDTLYTKGLFENRFGLQQMRYYCFLPQLSKPLGKQLLWQEKKENEYYYTISTLYSYASDTSSYIGDYLQDNF